MVLYKLVQLRRVVFEYVLHSSFTQRHHVVAVLSVEVVQNFRDLRRVCRSNRQPLGFKRLSNQPRALRPNNRLRRFGVGGQPLELTFSEVVLVRVCILSKPIELSIRIGVEVRVHHPNKRFIGRVNNWVYRIRQAIYCGFERFRCFAVFFGPFIVLRLPVIDPLFVVFQVVFIVVVVDVLQISCHPLIRFHPHDRSIVGSFIWVVVIVFDSCIGVVF